MKFNGIKIKNYRSFDSEGIFLEDLGKLKIIVGKNNSGKSNLLLFINQLPYFHGNDQNKQFDIHDYFNQESSNKISWSLRLKNDESGLKKATSRDGSIVELLSSKDLMTFDFNLEDSRSKFFINEAFPSDGGLHLGSQLDDWRTKTHRISGPDNANFFSLLLSDYLRPHLTNNIFLVGTYRQIGNDKETPDRYQKIYYDINGKDFIRRLDKLKSPLLTNKLDRKKFDAIEKFFKEILNEKELEINISSEEPKELSLNIRGKSQRIENLGTGISQLFLLSLAVILYEDSIFCIEEPEIFLHSEIQKRFIRFLATTNNQYFITTHSNAFMNIEGLDIYHFTNDGIKTIVEKVKSSQDKNLLLDDLGYQASDLLQSNFILWVEGPTDRIYINHWIRTINKNLIEGIHYSIMFYGGRLLSHLTVDEESLNDFIHLHKINRNSAILIDSDKENEDSEINETKKRVIKEFIEKNSFVWLTAGREIENYISEKLFTEGITDMGLQINDFPYGSFNKITSYIKKDEKKSIDKIALAHFVISKDSDLNVLDLNDNMHELVNKICQANSIQS